MMTITGANSVGNLDTSSSTTSIIPAHPDTFLKLCLLWTVLNKSTNFPPACKGVLTEERLMAIRNREDLSQILSSLSNSEDVLGPSYRPKEDDLINRRRNYDKRLNLHMRYTSKTLSVIGVLGGIVLILIVVALSTCIRTKRNMMAAQSQEMAAGHETFARQILIDHIRHLSVSRRASERSQRDRPPSYDDVVKDLNTDEVDAGDEEPPSYIEAMESRAQQAAAEAAESGQVTSQENENHVVMIEVNNSSETHFDQARQPGVAPDPGRS